MKTRLILALAAIALFAVATPPATAQDTDLKQRLEQRIPAIDDLRRRQVVGETNTGYLEVRGQATADEERIVADENADRGAVYERIARRSETTKEAVGRTRAKTIATASAPGVLIQNADGVWAAKR